MDNEFNDTFAVQSGDELDNMILTELKNEYLKVFEAALRKRCRRKHSVAASIESTSKEPIFCKACRLSPEKFLALGEKLKSDYAIKEFLKRVKAPGLAVVMVRKKSGGSKFVLTSLS